MQIPAGKPSHRYRVTPPMIYFILLLRGLLTPSDVETAAIDHGVGTFDRAVCYEPKLYNVSLRHHSLFKPQVDKYGKTTANPSSGALFGKMWICELR